MVVVDASAILELLLKRRSADAVRERLFGSGETLNAPHLIDIEVLHVIRRYARFGEVDDTRARAAISDHLQLPIERHAHDDLLGLAWQFRSNFSAYDAIYIALGIALDATFITADARLARAASSLLPVEVFA